jgi:hypothetical protein
MTDIVDPAAALPPPDLAMLHALLDHIPVGRS